MKRWPDKVVIGLTGNIATGKSVVRKMLEHLGAFGIDADALGHRALSTDSPGYEQAVTTFGNAILDADGKIDRAKLGRIVFADPVALKKLEDLVHPIIRQAIDLLVRKASQHVIVLEAIKLLEGDLYTVCDSIWVTTASPETQQSRLVRKRSMSQVDALQRIHAQSPQEQKISVADVVINNNGSLENTWSQVTSAWQKLFPEETYSHGSFPRPKQLVDPLHKQADILVERAQPEQALQIAQFLNQSSHGRLNMTPSDVMMEFGKKTYFLLLKAGKLIGVAGWRADDWIARVDDLFIQNVPNIHLASTALLGAMEQAANDFQCEIVLLFLSPHFAQRKFGWQSLGYDVCDVGELRIQAWQEAVSEALRNYQSQDVVIFFKQLRQDQVLHG